MEAHKTGTDMAKALVPYISDPARIRREILTNFDVAPSEVAIRAYRSSWVRQRKPTPVEIAPGVLREDDRYASDMERASEDLRNRVLSALAERHKREAARREVNERVRRDIRLGKHKGWIMREHGISETAYEQLAGQVRAGA